jgi:DNA-binding MarR family transcriptional regulator
VRAELSSKLYWRPFNPGTKAWVPMQLADARRIREATSILDDLRRVVRKLRESSREAEQRLGVSGAQLFVLRTLSGGERLSVNELATRTRTHQSTVSGVVSRLVDSGLVKRESSARDARRVELSVTPRGISLLAQAPLAAQDDLVLGIERLSGEQRAALASSLRALVVAMDLEAQEPAMFFEEEAPSPARTRAKKSKSAAPRASQSTTQSRRR